MGCDILAIKAVASFFLCLVVSLVVMAFKVTPQIRGFTLPPRLTRLWHILHLAFPGVGSIKWSHTGLDFSDILKQKKKIQARIFSIVPSSSVHSLISVIHAHNHITIKTIKQYIVKRKITLVTECMMV